MAVSLHLHSQRNKGSRAGQSDTPQKSLPGSRSPSPRAGKTTCSGHRVLRGATKLAGYTFPRHRASPSWLFPPFGEWGGVQRVASAARASTYQSSAGRKRPPGQESRCRTPSSAASRAATFLPPSYHLLSLQPDRQQLWQPGTHSWQHYGLIASSVGSL